MEPVSPHGRASCFPLGSEASREAAGELRRQRPRGLRRYLLDDHADLLYDLASQTVKHFQSYSPKRKQRKFSGIISARSPGSFIRRCRNILGGSRRLRDEDQHGVHGVEAECLHGVGQRLSAGFRFRLRTRTIWRNICLAGSPTACIQSEVPVGLGAPVGGDTGASSASGSSHVKASSNCLTSGARSTGISNRLRCGDYGRYLYAENNQNREQNLMMTR